VPRTKTIKQLSTRELHEITRVLSDPRRFEIFKCIAAHPCTACSVLRAAFPITAATVSHHLKELESSGLISTTRRGKFMDAALRRDVWKQYLSALKKI
jgi:ArsR family transcriptional regulator